MADRSKISKLPLEIRLEVNRRLRDGQIGETILPWLNALPEVQAILKDQFNGEAIRHQNLTNYRQGQYAAWLAQQDRLDHVRQQSEFCIQVSQASGASIADGTAQIVAGKILEILETIESSETLSAEDSRALLSGLVKDITLLRSGDADSKRLKLERDKLAEKVRQIDLDERRVKLLEEKAANAKAKLEQAVAKGGLTGETLKLVEDSLKLL